MMRICQELPILGFGRSSVALRETTQGPLTPSSTCDDGLARLPTGRVCAEPGGGLAGRTALFGFHIHAPGEDAAVRAVDSPLARGYARRSAEAGVEVSGGTIEDVDEARVVIFTQQTRLRQADLEQP